MRPKIAMWSVIASSLVGALALVPLLGLWGRLQVASYGAVILLTVIAMIALFRATALLEDCGPVLLPKNLERLLNALFYLTMLLICWPALTPLVWLGWAVVGSPVSDFLARVPLEISLLFPASLVAVAMWRYNRGEVDLS